VKFGKLAPRHDHRTALLYNFLNHEVLPPPKDETDWFAKMQEDLGMMGNDVAGDCSAAGLAHLLQLWTTNVGQGVEATTEEVIEIYKTLTFEANGIAYDPDALPDAYGENPTDTGLVLLDVLVHWKNIGFMIGGKLHQIGGFMKVNHNNATEYRTAIDMFGGLYTGVALPQAAMDALGRQWGAAEASGPVAGGHCMTAGKQNATGTTYVTWGKRQDAIWPWVLAATDEAYAVVSQDWIGDHGLAPSGLCIAKLTTYLQSL
jgi:hypothetical protein